MGGMTLPTVLAILFVSLAASLIVLWIIGMLTAKPTGFTGEVQDHKTTDSFLFHGEALSDHDVADWPQGLERFESWADMRDWLGERFDHLPAEMADLKGAGRIDASGDPTPTSPFMTFQTTGQTSRLNICMDHPPSPVAWLAAGLASNHHQEAQAILDNAPFPIWRTDKIGKLLWKNAPCMRIETALGALPAVPNPLPPGTAPMRFSVDHDDGTKPSWYEVKTQDFEDGYLNFATAIDQVVQAESTRREFVQTLTKTFANLTTGLAIFNRNRELTLFNPALVDLTGLSVNFLSARPEIIRFFDELREKQVLPEPKNYATLRAQIREVIARAHNDSYLEIWNLPGGATYRVTGRPHPDGAVAFLFEDISAEVLKTRQFRTQIDLGQSVIDGLEDAIVVIAPNNVLMLCNTACSTLLNIDPDSSFTDMSVSDLLAACEVKFQKEAQWTIFESTLRERTTLQDASVKHHLVARTGQRISYNVAPLPGGVRMVSFSAPEPAVRPEQVSAAE